MTYLDRAALLAALTNLQERDVDEPLLGGVVRIRELTAGERQQALDAALAVDPDNADNALYRAMVVSFGLVEPKLSIEDVGALREGRWQAVLNLHLAILGLSEAAPGDTKKPS